jgi:hypothetical protein
MPKLPAIALLMWAVALTGCATMAPVRTLPSWVQGVHVTMVRNQSFEPEVEEYATRAIQEAFLNDGRVNLVPEYSADMILRVSILDWDVSTAGSSGDEVATFHMTRVRAALALDEPYDPDDDSFTNLGTVEVREFFNTDIRSTRYVTEPDRRDLVLTRLADAVVQRTITGFPIDGHTLPTGIQPEQDARQINLDPSFRAEESDRIF